MSETKPSDEHIQLIIRLTRRLVDAHDVIEELQIKNARLSREILINKKTDRWDGHSPTIDNPDPQGEE